MITLDTKEVFKIYYLVFKNFWFNLHIEDLFYTDFEPSHLFFLFNFIVLFYFITILITRAFPTFGQICP